MRTDKMRIFPSGASRNSNKNKPDYEGFSHPLIVEAYGKYMNGHRRIENNKFRDSDNWQNLFGEEHCSVCIKSLYRHFVDLWFLHRGYKRFDKDDGHEITKEEACCAIKFNVNAYLYKILNEEYNKTVKKITRTVRAKPLNSKVSRFTAKKSTEKSNAKKR